MRLQNLFRSLLLVLWEPVAGSLADNQPCLAQTARICQASDAWTNQLPAGWLASSETCQEREILQAAAGPTLLALMEHSTPSETSGLAHTKRCFIVTLSCWLHNSNVIAAAISMLILVSDPASGKVCHHCRPVSHRICCHAYLLLR